MDFGAVRDLARDINFVTHGMPVVITPPDPNDTQIETRGIWLTFTSEDVPSGTGFQRKDARRVLSLKRNEVPSVPRLTIILAPDRLGGALREWIVDGTDSILSTTISVIVLPHGSPT